MELFPCRFLLICAKFFAVLILLIASSARAQHRNLSNSQSSSCPVQDYQSMHNVSFVGKAVFAECTCKQSLEWKQLQMCAAWKLLHRPFLQNSPIKIFKKFTIVRKPATASYATMTWGSCKEYANNIIHGLYRNVNLNFSTVGESSSYAIDWGFCNDSALRNKLGCNYTIVPARYHNGSFRTELHYFVRSFTETSQHLQLGKYYQFDIEKCKDAVVKIRVGADNNSLFSSRTTSGFFFFPTKRRTPEGHERTSHREPSTDNERQRKRNNGIHGVLLDNRVHTLCAATVLAVLKTF